MIVVLWTQVAAAIVATHHMTFTIERPLLGVLATFLALS
jgi:hypothetical protein